jgi:very-short-patch-repair endonuclease
VLDLAPWLPYGQLEHIFDEALKRQLMRRSHVAELLDRYPTRAGTKRLRALNDTERPAAWTRSRTERRLRTLIRQAGLPTPHSNTTVHGLELDLYWPDHRLNVETDGYDFHSAQRDLESDHLRDRRLQANGIMVLRFSARQVWEAPALVIAEIAAALAVRAAA